MRTPTLLSRLALMSAAGLALTLAPVATAAPDEFVKVANEMGAATPGTIHAEDILFPALMEMAQPPIAVGIGPELDAMLMLQPGDSAWRQMESWAEGDEQQAVLEVFKTLTDPDAKKAHVFDIPFGMDDTDPAYQAAGLWIEVQTDNLVSSAKYHYLDKVEWASALALFETMRLAEQGEGKASLDTMVNLLRFGRLLAERPSVEEVKAAFTLMRIASERTRDVVYTHPDSFEADDLVEAGEAFDERILRPRQIAMPGVSRVAAQQLLARTFEKQGNVKPGTFAQTFAMLEADDRPLRRLSEAARYRGASQVQGDWWDQSDWIEKVFGDYEARWIVPGWKDPLFDKTPQFEQADSRAVALVRYAAEGLSDLRDTRTALEIDLGGTMNALGAVAFQKQEGKLPPALSGIEPQYVNRLFKDPYNHNARYQGNVFYDMQFWVPMRDQTWDRRETPKPYAVEVVLPGEGESLFVAEAPKGGSADAVLRGLSDNRPALQQMIGRPAPEIALNDWHNTDSPITMAGASGDIRVVIFWATWCGPCKAAIPGNNEVFAKYKDKGVTLFGICDSNQGRSMARTADQHKMAYPTGMMGNDNNEAKAYNLPHWPFAVIIDRVGTIRGAGIWPKDLDKAVAALLAEQPKGWIEKLDAEIAAVDQDIENAWADVGLDMSELADMKVKDVWAAFDIDVPQDIVDRYGDMTTTEISELAFSDPQAVQDLGEISMEVAQRIRPGMFNGETSKSYTANLDDTTFLLYSTGPDGMDNRAKKVGAGGDDVLMWPPLMSLTRKHLHNEL